jgi:hypothetical protein
VGLLGNGPEPDRDNEHHSVCIAPSEIKSMHDFHGPDQWYAVLQAAMLPDAGSRKRPPPEFRSNRTGSSIFGGACQALSRSINRSFCGWYKYSMNKNHIHQARFDPA